MGAHLVAPQRHDGQLDFACGEVDVFQNRFCIALFALESSGYFIVDKQHQLHNGVKVGTTGYIPDFVPLENSFILTGIFYICCVTQPAAVLSNVDAFAVEFSAAYGIEIADISAAFIKFHSLDCAGDHGGFALVGGAFFVDGKNVHGLGDSDFPGGILCCQLVRVKITIQPGGGGAFSGSAPCTHIVTLLSQRQIKVVGGFVFVVYQIPVVKEVYSGNGSLYF